MPNLRTGIPWIALVGGLLVAPMLSQARQEETSAAVEPAALDAIKRMGAYLQTLKSFEIRSQTTLDEGLAPGQKLHFENSVHLRVRRPDRLWAEVASDRKMRQFFYDGKSFTLYGPRNQLYATFAAPATLREAVAAVEEKYGISLPLADLFRWGSEPLQSDSIRAATYVGPARIDERPCDHFAFREDGVDWQVWIQKGDSPLPRKLVLTATDDGPRPQYSAVLDWNLAPALNDSMFTFEPPPGAYRISIQEIALEPAAEN